MQEDTDPRYDITSESYNLCPCCGFSWCECGFEREDEDE